jgi:hypothetical protein
MIQVDTMCHKIPHFIEKAKRAGVTRVFIGLENINPDNLIAAKKKQNKITEYRKMLLAWKREGILVFAGYILGFPGDTPESIRRDINIIKRELPIDVLELNILTPLPGSEDHKILWSKGADLDQDLNKYDLEHVVTDHAKMTREQLQKIYEEVWALYFTREHIKTLLKRAAVTNVPLRSLAKALIQFSSQMQLENIHPLQSGLFRMKHPDERRPGLPRESAWTLYPRHLRDLIVRNARYIQTILSIQMMRWQIERDPNKHLYIDQALMPVHDETEEKTFDYLTKTDGAKAAIDHLKKVAELTHKTYGSIA